MWNNDEMEGNGKRVEVAMKEKAGGLITNPDLEVVDKAGLLEGTVQKSVGEVRPDAADALGTTGKDISGK